MTRHYNRRPLMLGRATAEERAEAESRSIEKVDRYLADRTDANLAATAPPAELWHPFCDAGKVASRGDLTLEEVVELESYAAMHGKYWKSDLQIAWEGCSIGPVLLGLRNSARFGVRGLRSYKRIPTKDALKLAEQLRKQRAAEGGAA